MNQNIETEDIKFQVDKKPSPKHIPFPDLPLQSIASFALFMASASIIFLKFQNRGHGRKAFPLNQNRRGK